MELVLISLREHNLVKMPYNFFLANLETGCAKVSELEPTAFIGTSDEPIS